MIKDPIRERYDKLGSHRDECLNAMRVAILFGHYENAKNLDRIARRFSEKRIEAAKTHAQAISLLGPLIILAVVTLALGIISAIY